MECFINKIVTDSNLSGDIKSYIPDASMRRRMSKVVKNSVACAVECMGNIENIKQLDAIITATGWGCLTDSERFLRNIIVDKEQLINPTPFIQSTFNTVGGQIALMAKNHCYNVTYVNRSHSFEDALLDTMMRFADGEATNILLGAFDEETHSQHEIMKRMGLFRNIKCGDGCVFTHLTSCKTHNSKARVVLLDFPQKSLNEKECIAEYSGRAEHKIFYNSYKTYGLFPTASAFCFAKAAELAEKEEKRVIVYNEFFGAKPTVIVIECIV